MILPRYEPAFRALTQPELHRLLPALGLPLVHPSSSAPFRGADLLAHCRAQHVSHADVIMSLAHDTTPEAVSCVERLIMRPIDRRTPTEVNISRLERPPGSHRATPRSPTAGPDLRIIRILTETNPKRPGSASHPRFALYTDGATVDSYLQKGGRRADIAWDTEKGFIALADPGSTSVAQGQQDEPSS